jgi:hypothetical protein
VRREVALADGMNKPLVIYKVGNATLPTGGLAFYLSLEHLQTDLDQVLRGLIETRRGQEAPTADGPKQTSAIQRFRRRFLLSIAASVMLLLYLSFWFARFTDLNVYSYASLGTIGAVVTIYKALTPAYWRNRAAWMLTEFNMAAFPWWPVMPGILAVGACATLLFGSVNIESAEATPRQVCVESPGIESRCETIDRDHRRTFLIGPMWRARDVSVVPQNLPRKVVHAGPMQIASLSAPNAFLPDHLLLLAPDSVIRALHDHPLTMLVEVSSGNAKSAKRIPIRSLRQPVWIGCVGSLQVTESMDRDAAVASGSSTLPCECETPLQTGDEVSIQMLGVEGGPLGDPTTALIDKRQFSVLALRGT